MVEAHRSVPPTPDLTPFEWLVLSELCSVNGCTASEIWRSIQESKLASTRPMLEASLDGLKALGLARSLSIGAAPLWLRTSEGELAYNWKKQLEWPDPGPEPRTGETGSKKAAQPCDQFRPFRPSPGYCWCGWFRTEHTPEAQSTEGDSP